MVTLPTAHDLARSIDGTPVNDDHPLDRPDANRLDDADRERIAATVRDTVTLWLAGSTGHWKPAAHDALALMRVAIHSIGCTASDLRMAELDEIAELVVAALTRLP